MLMAPTKPVNPQAAFAAGLKTMPFLRGSATVTVATLGKEDSILRVYNLGDSGLQVWRWDPQGSLDPLIPARSERNISMPQTGAWRLRFHTETQQSQFNAPFQVRIMKRIGLDRHDIYSRVFRTLSSTLDSKGS